MKKCHAVFVLLLRALTCFVHKPLNNTLRFLRLKLCEVKFIFFPFEKNGSIMSKGNSLAFRLELD